MTEGKSRAPSDDAASVTAEASSRSRGIDACRVLAAVLVIWIHATSGVHFSPLIVHTMLGLIGVPFFTAAAMLFAVRHAYRGVALSALVMSRVRRILIPFVIWAVFYWVASDLIFGRILSGVPLTFEWREAMKGFTWHLWFLPFVFVMSTLAVLISRVTVRTAAVAAGAALCAILGAVAVFGVPATSDVSFARWPYELPVALVSLAGALAMQRRWVRVRTSGVVAATLWLGVVVFAVYGLLEGEPPARRSAQAAGVLMLAAALATPDRFIPEWLARLGSLGYSVYVVHVVILQVTMMLLERGGPLTPAGALTLFVITVVLSFIAAWLGKRTPIVRRAFP